MAYAIKNFNRSLLNPAAKAFQPRMGAGRGTCVPTECLGVAPAAGAAVQAVAETGAAGGAAAGVEFGVETGYDNEGTMWQDPAQVMYGDNGAVVGCGTCCENHQQVQSFEEQSQQPQLQLPPQLLWVPISQVSLLNGQVLHVYPLQGYSNGSATNAAGVDGCYQQQQQQQQELSYLPPTEQMPQEMPQQLINAPMAVNYQPVSIVYQQMQPQVQQLPQQTANVAQLPQQEVMSLMPYQQVGNVYVQQQSPPQQQQQLQYSPQQHVQYVQHQQQFEQQQQEQLSQQPATLQYLPQQSSYMPQQPMSVVYQQLPQTSNISPQLSPMSGYQQLPNNYQMLPQHYGNYMQVVQQAAAVDGLDANGVGAIKTYMCNNRGFNRAKQIINKPKRRTQQQLEYQPQPQQQQQQPQPQQVQSRYKYQQPHADEPQPVVPLTSIPHSQWHQIIMSSIFNILLDEGEPISYAFIVSQLSLRLNCAEELMKRLVPNVLYDASNKGYVRRSNGHFMLGVNALNGMHKFD